MPSSNEPAGTQLRPSLLLVEEYDALAVAIGSALRKFAPDYDRRVVSSLAEASETIEKTRPQLIIIDLDPPQEELVPFVERARAAHPLARILAIGCGTSLEFTAARRDAGGIHFVEKPFELEELGAAVRQLLKDDGGENAETAGTLALSDLLDLAALECVNGRNVILRVETGGGRVGELHFARGQLCHAVAPGLVDVEALEEMMRWDHPHFAESERPATAPRTINAPWGGLLAKLANRKRKAAADVERTPARAPKRKRAVAPARKIVVIDDTSLLLDFVEEVLTTADPDLHIATAHTGTEGVRRSELGRPDLVLLDYSLPDINGDEVCRRLLANEATAQIPIVMMSGHVAEMMRTAETFSNVVATIAKPFLSHDLVRVVTETLAKNLKPAPPVKPAEPAPTAAPIPAPPVVAKSHAHNGHGKANGASRNGGSARPAAPPTPPAAPVAETVITAPEPASEPEPAPPVTLPEQAAPAHRAESLATPLVVEEPAPQPPAALTVAATIAEPPPTLRGAMVTLPEAAVVLIGLSLKTIAVQLNETLRIARIRARPQSRTVSLNFPPEIFPAVLALRTGFDIESIDIDNRGQLETVRLAPNRRPLEIVPTSRRFSVDDVEIETAGRLELTPNQSSAMPMQMVAAFKLQGVELTPTFEVARLVLGSCGPRVRVSLDPNAAATGAIFETLEVRRDGAGQIEELAFRPIEPQR